MTLPMIVDEVVLIAGPWSVALLHEAHASRTRS